MLVKAFHHPSSASQPDIRRIRLERADIQLLKQQVADRFSLAQVGSITYQDEDNDRVTLECQADLDEAVLQMTSAPLKIFVTAPAPAPAPTGLQGVQMEPPAAVPAPAPASGDCA